MFVVDSLGLVSIFQSAVLSRSIFPQRSGIDVAASYPGAGHSEGMLLCLQWFVCLGVTIALAVLGGWHLYLISISETTIEFYTNKRDARRKKEEGEVGQ